MADSTSLQEIVEAVSRDLRLRMRGTASSVDTTGNTLIIGEIASITPQSQSPVSSFLSKVDGSSVRRITNYLATTGVITYYQDPGVGADDPFANGDFLDVYSLLLPDDYKRAANRALANLFVIHRELITPIDGQNEYPLPAWVSLREQLQDILIRYNQGDNFVRESSFGGYTVNVSDGETMLLLHTIPSGLSGMSYVAVLRRYYDPLELMTDRTACPRQLIMAGTKYEALQAIWNMLGEEPARKMFGSEYQDALAHYTEKKLRFLPRATSVPLTLPQQFIGPEFAFRNNDGRW